MRRCPCRCRWTSAGRRWSPRGTCWSNPGSCWCRIPGRRAGRERRPRWRRGRRCRIRPYWDPAGCAGPRRCGRRPGPRRSVCRCRLRCRRRSVGQAAFVLQFVIGPVEQRCHRMGGEEFRRSHVSLWLPTRPPWRRSRRTGRSRCAPCPARRNRGNRSRPVCWCEQPRRPDDVHLLTYGLGGGTERPPAAG